MLSPHKLVAILCNAGLKCDRQPVLTPRFPKPALRLKPNGDLVPASDWEEMGLLYRPTVTQISRWDRLKGFDHLLNAFIHLKERRKKVERGRGERYQRLLEIVRLVLAGPDPSLPGDDPDAAAVFQEIASAYRNLSPEHQADVAVLTLPVDSRKENALMVNALRRWWCRTPSERDSGSPPRKPCGKVCR
jgi:trehalose synthase